MNQPVHGLDGEAEKIYLKRKKLGRALRWLRDKLNALGEFYKRHENTISKCAQSRVTPFLLFGLIIVSLFISRLLTLLAIFFFCVVVIYQISLHRGKKARDKSKHMND